MNPRIKKARCFTKRTSNGYYYLCLERLVISIVTFIRKPILQVSILEVSIEYIFEWKMQNLTIVLTDTAVNTSKQPTISVVICSRSLNRSLRLCSFFVRSYLCPIARIRERRIMCRSNRKEGRMDVGIWDWEWSRVLW